MTLSLQGEDILSFIRDSRENLFIEAGPGSGKTTMLAFIAKTLPQDGSRHVALAFARNNADDFQRKLPFWVESSTFHSLCKRVLPTARVSTDKCKHLLKNLMPTWSERKEIQSDVLRLVSLLKHQDRALYEAEVEALASVHDIEPTSEVVSITNAVLKASDEKSDVIDFDDMLRFAARPSVVFPRFATVMVDEAQDTNGVQRLILEKLCVTARLIIVGDPFQAVYAFRGADADALRRICEVFACATLPLSVSYRCSRKVCAEANRVISHEYIQIRA